MKCIPLQVTRGGTECNSGPAFFGIRVLILISLVASHQCHPGCYIGVDLSLSGEPTVAPSGFSPRESLIDLSENFVNHGAVDVGQAVVAALVFEDQAFVVQAHTMQ